MKPNVVKRMEQKAKRARIKTGVNTLFSCVSKDYLKLHEFVQLMAEDYIKAAQYCSYSCPSTHDEKKMVELFKVILDEEIVEVDSETREWMQKCIDTGVKW